MRIYFFLTFIFVVSSCGESESNSVQGNSDEVNVAVDTCNCVDLDVDSLGIHKKSGELFSGVCNSYYEGTTSKYIEKNIFEGKIHGRVSYFDKSGELLLEELYEDGVLKRNPSEMADAVCDCTALESQTVQGVSVYKLNGNIYTGKCEKFYENTTQLYMESHYKNGLLDGYTTYYNRDGSTILMEKYERGVQTSVVH